MDRQSNSAKPSPIVCSLTFVNHYMIMCYVFVLSQTHVNEAELSKAKQAIPDSLRLHADRCHLGSQGR